MTETKATMSAAINRIADRMDLAIDLLTLGQYGLEKVPAGRAGCEGCGPRADWEALPPARRRRASREPAIRRPRRLAC